MKVGLIATTVVNPSILPDALLVMSCGTINATYSLGISDVCAGVNMSKCMRIYKRRNIQTDPRN